MSKEEIIRELQLVYAGEPWYGNGIRELLDQIPTSSAEHPHWGRTIAKILAHMIAWREFAIDSLKGRPTKDMSRESIYEWPAVEAGEWPSLLAKLERSQMDLIVALGALEDSDLDKQVEGKPYDQRVLTSGIIQHDIYHLGQIGMLHSLYKKQ